MSSWSIEAWCANQEQQLQQPGDVVVLDVVAQALLDALPNATIVHPFCTSFTDATYGIAGCPPQGPLLFWHNHEDHSLVERYVDVVVTAAFIFFPSLLAMAELWLRLLASLIAPIGVLHLLYLATSSSNRTKITTRSSSSSAPLWIKMITTASALVVWTDTLYVYEFGSTYGGVLFIASLVLGSYETKSSSSKSSKSSSLSTQRRLWQIFSVAAVFVTALLIVRPDGTVQWGNTHDIPSHVPEGLYYKNDTEDDTTSSSVAARSIVKHWAEETRTYDEARRTPWFPSGDSRTGMPFLLNRVEQVQWVRRWLPMAADGEVVAFDFAFPTMTTKNAHDDDRQREVFYHDPAKPLYIVLHGLNGGSQEEYVRDFALSRIRDGSTVVVMVARGLMDLPIRGWNIFHGARWTDAYESMVAVRAAAGPDQFVAAVGYSMGAAILGNVMTKRPPVDAAVAISGGLDMRAEFDFYRARRLWQPLLVPKLRDTFVVGKWGERVRERLTAAQLKSLLRASHITGVDQAAVVTYNGYRDVLDYYADMSALGDVPPDEFDKQHFDPSRRM
jgi:predicted alpha/beta-fold hydrolase